MASWDGATDLTPALMSDFSSMLTERCLELMDPAMRFEATRRKEHCRYCDVRNFCPQHP